MNQIRSWLIPIEEFYICGLNVFECPNNSVENNYNYEIKAEEISDVDNSCVEYANVKNAVLSHYETENYDFYIATSKVDRFYLVTLFVEDGSAYPEVDNETYIKVNNFMFNKLNTDEEKGVIYSEDKKRRVVIEPRDDGLFLYTVESVDINVWAMIDFPRYTSEIYNDFFCFDYIRECLFATKEDAIDCAKTELNIN